MTIVDVQSLIEDHLKQLVIKHFDPKMADTIFKDESGVSPVSRFATSWTEEVLWCRRLTG